MSVLLSVSHPDWDDEDLQSLTDELFQALEEETDTHPRLLTTEAKAGTKAAEMLEIASIVLTTVGSAPVLVQIFIANKILNQAKK